MGMMKKGRLKEDVWDVPNREEKGRGKEGVGGSLYGMGLASWML